MGNMNYYRAENAEEAVALLEQYSGKAMLLAGGTDIMVQVNQSNVSEDTVFIGIEDIKEMKEIRQEGKELHIGSMVTDFELIQSDEIRSYARALYMAAKESASPQVRNRATIGGNVATASPSGDLLAALIALEADAIIAGKNGVRTLKVQDIPVFVKKTCLAPEEVIKEFVLTISAEKEGSYFVKMGKRKAMTISIVNVAAKIELTEDNTKIKKAVIAAGACAPTIVRLTALENALTGEDATEEAVQKLARKALEDVAPITDIRASEWYRRELVQVFAVRAVMGAIKEALKEE